MVTGPESTKFSREFAFRCMAELDAKLKEYRIVLTELRREVRISNRIEDRLLNKVEPMLAASRVQEEIMQELHPNSHMKAQQEIKEIQEREARERKAAYYQRDRGGR